MLAAQTIPTHADQTVINDKIVSWRRGLLAFVATDTQEAAVFRIFDHFTGIRI